MPQCLRIILLWCCNSHAGNLSRKHKRWTYDSHTHCARVMENSLWIACGIRCQYLGITTLGFARVGSYTGARTQSTLLYNVLIDFTSGGEHHYHAVVDYYKPTASSTVSGTSLRAGIESAKQLTTLPWKLNYKMSNATNQNLWIPHMIDFWVCFNN